MDYRDALLGEARKAIAEHLEQRSKIIELYQMAMAEIEDGCSESNEYELFMSSIEEIKQGSQ